MDPIRSDIRVIEPRQPSSEALGRSQTSADKVQLAQLAQGTQRKDLAKESTRTQSPLVQERPQQDSQQGRRFSYPPSVEASDTSTDEAGNSQAAFNSPAARTDLSRSRLFYSAESEDLSPPESTDLEQAPIKQASPYQPSATVNKVAYQRAAQAYRATDPSDESQDAQNNDGNEVDFESDQDLAFEPTAFGALLAS